MSTHAEAVPPKHEFRNESVVVPCKSQKTLDLHNSCGCEPIPDSLYFTFHQWLLLWQKWQVLGRLNASGIAHILRGFSFSPASSNFQKTALSLFKVASQIFGKDDYVIQIDDTPMEIEVP